MATSVVGVARYFAVRVITPDVQKPQPVTVVSVQRSAANSSVTLTRGEDAALSGTYSFIFDGGSGHARLGTIVSEAPHTDSHNTVTRKLLEERRGTLRAGTPGRITGSWYDRESIQAEGLGTVEDVTVVSELGGLQAWLIHPPKSSVADHLAIHVHGRGAGMEETLRGVQPFSETGAASLVISYRNDESAQVAAGGKYGLGTTEWRDVEAALAFARERGYRRVTLFGWSMGATACLLAAEKTRHADLVAALILESPAVDWPEILAHQAKLAGLPSWIGKLATRLLQSLPRTVGLRESIEVSKLNPKRFANSLTVPTLIIVSDGDTFVQMEGALELAKTRQDLVKLYRAPHGEHVKIWNCAREEWTRQVSEFINLSR